MEPTAIVSLPDDELLSRARSLAADARRSTVELIELIAEIERRDIHLAEGHASIFNYCRDALRLSEGEAANRLVAARASRAYPVILGLLRSGEINMTTVRLLAPHLTSDNHAAVLDEARGKTRPQVEEIVARLAPRARPAPTLRQVAAPAPRELSLPSVTLAPPPVAPSAPPARTVRPLSAELYRLSVTMSGATRAAWERARELVDGDDAAVLAALVGAGLPCLERQRRGDTDSPRRPRRPTAPHSRHVPAQVKREVAARDGGRCAFVGRHGQRCTMRRHLQYHHVAAWIAGGPTTSANLQLRCPAHNRYEARILFSASRAGRESGSLQGRRDPAASGTCSGT